MRKDLLAAAESEFFRQYPGGFNNPEMEIIKKKHKLEKMHAFAKEVFAEDRFGFIEVVLDDMIKMVSRSSMVSVFEKPKFRDFARSLSPDEKEVLVMGLYEILHGDQGKGYAMSLDILGRGKLAKWSIISVCPYYYAPQEEVFMKPTTVKNIVRVFELEGLVYKPRPSYDFYVNYRKVFLEMKGMSHPDLGPDNAGFSGFLMMMMEGL